MEAVWAFRVRLALKNGISVQTGSGSLSNNMSPAEPWINGTLAVNKKQELTSSGLLRVSAMHLFVAAGKIILLCSQLLAPSALKVLWKSPLLEGINVWTYCVNHGVSHWLNFILSRLFKLPLKRKRFQSEGQFFRPWDCFRKALQRKGFWERELDGVPLKGILEGWTQAQSWPVFIPDFVLPFIPSWCCTERHITTIIQNGSNYPRLPSLALQRRHPGENGGPQAKK